MNGKVYCKWVREYGVTGFDVVFWHRKLWLPYTKKLLVNGAERRRKYDRNK
jgi:hypothetical protein